MRNIMDDFYNSATDSGLYCVWVLVHDDRGDRLVSVWIDRAMTAFKSSAPVTPDGAGTAESQFAGHRDWDVLAGEHPTSIIPRCS
jgi:hypothetical protein